MKKLKIALVSSFSTNEYDFKLREVFNNLFASLKSEFSDFAYSEIDFINFSFNDEPELLAENCIATLNPVKYLVSKEVEARVMEDEHTIGVTGQFTNQNNPTQENNIIFHLNYGFSNE